MPAAQITPENITACVIIGVVFLLACVVVLFLDVGPEEPKTEFDQPVPEPVDDAWLDRVRIVGDEFDIDKFLERLLIQTNEVMIGMGATNLFDYAHEGSAELEERLGRCYELAAKALFPNYSDLDPAAPTRTPVGILHGRWRGPGNTHTIDHAVVQMSDGTIWEPITRAVCNSSQFCGYTRWQTTKSWTASEAQRQMVKTQHFGPWHG